MGRISKNKQAPPTEVGKPQPEKRKAEGYVPRSGGKKLKLGPDGKKLKKAPAKKEAAAAPKKASKSKAVKSAEDLWVLVSFVAGRVGEDCRRRRLAATLLSFTPTCAPFVVEPLLIHLILAAGTTWTVSVARRMTKTLTRRSRWQEGMCQLFLLVCCVRS